MSFKAGDLIYYLTISSEERYRPNRIAIVISKSYQAYNEKYSRYKVHWLARDEVIELTSHSMRHINDKV